MDTKSCDLDPVEDPQAQLAKTFIEEYLNKENQSLETVHLLPEKDAKCLLVKASIYASTKMAELESRAHVVKSLHGISQT
ncbi:MAG TPA: hypothetical protein VF932_10005 [Anaerolineae bacterium]